MRIIRNEQYIPHQAIIFTNRKSIDSFLIDKVGIAYQIRNDCIGRDGAIWEIEFHLTNSCNLKCNGCSYGTRHNGNSLTIDQVCSVLKKYEKYDLKTVFFSGGGDPLLWKLWKVFFTRIDKKYNYGIATNMFNFGEIRDYWNYFDFYQIHVTGYDDITSKTVTGINSFSRINENISYLLERRTSSQEIALKILINEENYLQIPMYLDYIMNKNADSVILKFQQNFLFNQDLANDTIIDKIRHLSYNHPIANEYDYLIDNMDDIIFTSFPCPEKCFFANSGLYRLINANGEIFPCIAANANINNKISNEKGFIDIYSKEMINGRCPIRACRHYRFSQYLSQLKNTEYLDLKKVNIPVLL